MKNDIFKVVLLKASPALYSREDDMVKASPTLYSGEDDENMASPTPYNGEDGESLASPTPYNGEDGESLASPTPYSGEDDENMASPPLYGAGDELLFGVDSVLCFAVFSSQNALLTVSIIAVDLYHRTYLAGVRPPGPAAPWPELYRGRRPVPR